MTIENEKTADNNYEMEKLINELTSVVEQEVEAFRILLDGLLEHQTTIVRGDTESVSKSLHKVEKLVKETRKIKDEVRGKKNDLAKVLNVDGNIPIEQIVPMVEERYAERLNELRNMLNALSGKISEANSRNLYLLNHSLRFVDNCIKMLAQGGDQQVSYSKRGIMASREASLYNGIG
ncbi:flagellar protein FlgN [bacterium]|nr:flagellar protein FlgN [bacterium]